MSGFVAMQREALEHPLFRGNPDRFYAWFWLVARAAWKPTPFDIGGRVITLERGQVCASVRQLGDAWGMSKSAAERFITRLKTETMIEVEAGQGRMVITICNYGKYQDTEKADRDSSGTPTGTAAGQQRDIKEPLNHITKVEEAKASPTKRARAKAVPFVLPDWVPAEQWTAFEAMRQTIKKPMTDYAKTLVVGELRRLAEDGHPPGKVLDQSTRLNWQDVYEIKDRTNGHANRGSPAHNSGQPDRRNGFERACDRAIERTEAERREAGRVGDGSQRALAAPGAV